MLAHDSKPSMLLQQTERDKIYYAERALACRLSEAGVVRGGSTPSSRR
jgi:hypothetical protein